MKKDLAVPSFVVFLCSQTVFFRRNSSSPDAALFLDSPLSCNPRQYCAAIFISAVRSQSGFICMYTRARGHIHILVSREHHII